jgi:N-acetylglucosamine transport system substrate-binding protein
MSDSQRIDESGAAGPSVSRRAALRAAAATALVVVPGGSLLGACATSTDSGSGAQTGASKGPKNPLGVKEDAALEVVIFDGGYTDKYAVQVHEPLYKAAFPKAEIKHSKQTEIGKALQPRFSAGNPPDVVNNSGSGLMDFGALVADSQMLDLTPLWNAPSVDDPSKTVKDTVVPGTVEVGSFDGKPYVLYYVSTVFGLWYSGKLFKDKGWTAPTDWDGFLKLLDNLKAAGLTAYAYAGANAAYYQWNVILTHAAKLGGEEVLKAIDNLEDGAWKNESVIKAATMWGEVGVKYMPKSYEGLKHTDVQLQQDQYKVGIYPSGDWLSNEQSKDAPADFQYQMMPIPDKGKLSAAGLRATAGEGFFVPAKAKNTAGGLEYLRQMLSKAGGKGFADLIKSPTVVVGASEGVDFGSGVSSSQAALKAAGKDVVNLFFDGWYGELDKEARNATNALMFGRINAAAWADQIQKKADAVKKDSAVKKFKR